MRTFDEISASIAEITGVSQNDPGVRAAMDEVRQSLPAIPSVEAYVSSHQAAIGRSRSSTVTRSWRTRPLRASMFPGFDFTATPAAAFANENALFDPLLNRVLGITQLAHQPDKNAARTELSQLVNGSSDRSGSPRSAECPTAGREQRRGSHAQRSRRRVCTAVVGSAAMLVQ